MTDHHIGAFLRETRIARGISQKAAAAAMQISTSYINDIEFGRRAPSERVLWDIAAVLDLDVCALHAMAGRIPNACRPRNYDKALAAMTAYRQVVRCGPRKPV